MLGGFFSILSSVISPFFFLTFLSSFVSMFVNASKISFYANMGETLYSFLLFLFGLSIDYNERIKRLFNNPPSFEHYLDVFFIVIQVVGFLLRYLKVVLSREESWALWGEYALLLSHYFASIAVFLFRNPQLRRHFYMMAIAFIVIIMVMDWYTLQGSFRLTITPWVFDGKPTEVVMNQSPENQKFL